MICWNVAEAVLRLNIITTATKCPTPLRSQFSPSPPPPYVSGCIRFHGPLLYPALRPWMEGVTHHLWLFHSTFGSRCIHVVSRYSSGPRLSGLATWSVSMVGQIQPGGVCLSLLFPCHGCVVGVRSITSLSYWYRVQRQVDLMMVDLQVKASHVLLWPGGYVLILSEHLCQLLLKIRKCLGTKIGHGWPSSLTSTSSISAILTLCDTDNSLSKASGAMPNPETLLSGTALQAWVRSPHTAGWCYCGRRSIGQLPLR